MLTSTGLGLALAAGLGLVVGAVALATAAGALAEQQSSAASAAAAPRTPGLSSRLLWDRRVDGDMGGVHGAVSANGEWLAFPYWNKCSLGARNLKTGESRFVTRHEHCATSNGKTEHSVISPDGKLIAFIWERWDEGAKTDGLYQVRVVRADGTGERPVITGPENGYAQPWSWSPDGQWLAAVAMDNKGPASRLLVVSADGSQSRVVYTVPDRQVYGLWFSPDGKWLTYETSAPGTPQLPPMVLNQTRNQRVFVVPTDGSAPGAEVVSDADVMGWTPDGSGVVFRRQRNTLMELYVQPVSNGRPAGPAWKVPGVTDVGHGMGVTAQGTLFYGIFKQTADAVAYSVDPSNGVIGPPAVMMPVARVGSAGMGGAPRFSPDGTQVIYAPTANTLLVRSLVDGTERTLSPQMTKLEWIEWAADGGSLFIAGAAAGGTGVYRVDLKSGAAALLFDAPAVWPMLPSPDGRLLYYVKRAAAAVVLARDLKTGEERTLATHGEGLSDLNLSRDGKTLALMGPRILTFMDLQTRGVSERFKHEELEYDRFASGEFSADGRHFLAYVTFSLGRFGRTEIWSLPVAGGPPIRQAVQWPLRGLSLSRDGTQLGTMRLETPQQVWAVDGLLSSASRR